ncbi:MAG TPA: M28 family metallopeptidase [Candidatus Krumholzibacteria bacterium]|nr:M28 family metallopeptidase [Candidatus Krumholzibacteria bacterium]
MKLLSIIQLIGTVALLGGSTPGAEAPRNAGRNRALATINEADMGRHVATLASDEFGGRAPSTPGEKKTLDYITARFEEFGVLAPPGGYLQEVPLQRKTVSGRSGLVVKSKGGKTGLTLGENMVVRTGGNADRVVIKDSELVFVGYGIVADELGWNDYDGVDVTGKTVVVLMNDPAGVADSLWFKGRALSHYGTALSKRETAARRGARGVIHVHDQDVIGYPFDAIATNAKRPGYELLQGPESAPTPEFWATIPKPVAAAILSGAGADFDALAASAATHGFNAVTLRATVSGEVRVEIERSKSYNVVGYVKGSERPDEYVVYTAHWDHVGIGAAVDGDSIYNGAVDNATGTAALLELAQAFTALPGAPRRSVVFVATAAEEQGLLGAYHYTDHPVFPLEWTVGVINMDALFPFADWNGMTVVALGSSELEDYLRAAAAELGRGLQADPTPEHGAFFRSDHYPFAKKGVPAIFAIGGPLDEPAPDEAVMQRFSDYVSNSYHRPSDEYGDDWNLTGITGDVKVYFLTGYAIAGDDRVPNWYFTSEFRALRDRQLQRTGVMGGN